MHKILVIRLYFPLDALHVSDYISPSSGTTFYKLYIAFGISQTYGTGIKLINISIITTTATSSSSEAIPLQGWTGPEGSRRLRLPDFKTIGTCRW